MKSGMATVYVLLGSSGWPLTRTSRTRDAAPHLELGAEARFERCDPFRRSRVVGKGLRDRQQLVESFDRAPRQPVDVDARHEFRVRTRLADERSVLGGGDQVVLMSA